MTKGVLFILAVWVFACVCAILNPWVGFIGYTTYAILCPQWNWRFGWYYGIDYQKFLAITTIIGVVLTGALSTKLESASKKAIFCFSVFIGLTWISSLQTINVLYTAKFWDTIWKMWMMSCLGIFLIDDLRKAKWFLWVMVLSQGWNAYNVNELYYKWGINVRYFEWNYNDNNTYSISAAPIMAMSFALMLVHRDVRIRLFCGLIFVLQIHQIMFLASRGTMIGAMVLCGLGFFFMPKNKQALQVFFVGCVCAVILAGPSVVEEFNSAFKPQGDLDSSANSRYLLWKAGTKITLENPLLGVGPWAGQFLVPELVGEIKQRKALHNLFFDISTGVGIPGVTFYLLFFYVPWFAHLRIWLRGEVGDEQYCKIINLASLCGIPGYWAASMFSSGAFLESSYLLVCLSCVGLKLSEIEREKRLEELDREDEFMDEEYQETGDLDEELVAAHD